MKLNVGDMAPGFSLRSDTESTVDLADLRGQKVVVYFYPKAGTSGCTRQACSLAASYPRFSGQGVTVVGISPDEPKALAGFRAKHDLPFILLSDPDHKVAEAYGAWGTKTAFGRKTEGIVRSHFAINGDGRLTAAAYRVKPEDTAVLAESLQ